MASKAPKFKTAKHHAENNCEIAEVDSTSESSPFSSPWHLCDLVLKVQRRKFHVHKCILSMWSVFFEKMFTSDFKEKSAKAIALPGKSAHEIEVLLKLIYFKEKHSVTHDSFEFLLKLADEYQIEEVKKLCSDFMVSTIHKNNSLHYCQVADQYDLDDEVMSKCVNKATLLSTSTIEDSTHFDETSTTGKLQITLEKSKTLEKKIETLKELLNEYYITCFELVEEIYLAAAVNSMGCDLYHDFLFECPNCIRRVEEYWPIGRPYSLLETIESSAKKLHSILLKPNVK